MKVILISGDGHSGSTIVERVIGTAPSVWPVGEAKLIWRKVARGQRCSCREHIRECPEWTAFSERAFGGWDSVPFGRHWRAQKKLLSLRSTLLLRLWPARVKRGPGWRALLDRGRLYAAIGEVTGARAIVDASKDAYYGRALASVPGIEVTIVHLVRDPRLLIASRDRRRKAGRHLSVWLRKHLRAEVAWAGRRGTLTVRYEDFCRDPSGTVEAVLAAAGLSPEGVPRGPVFALPQHHLCNGNKGVKWGSGDVAIREPGASVPLPRQTHALITAAAAPFLLRYGYGRR